jgi:hypothetical protein
MCKFTTHSTHQQSEDYVDENGRVSRNDNNNNTRQGYNSGSRPVSATALKGTRTHPLLGSRINVGGVGSVADARLCELRDRSNNNLNHNNNMNNNFSGGGGGGGVLSAIQSSHRGTSGRRRFGSRVSRFDAALSRARRTMSGSCALPSSKWWK